MHTTQVLKKSTGGTSISESLKVFSRRMQELFPLIAKDILLYYDNWFPCSPPWKHVHPPCTCFGTWPHTELRKKLPKLKLAAQFICVKLPSLGMLATMPPWQWCQFELAKLQCSVLVLVEDARSDHRSHQCKPPGLAENAILSKVPYQPVDEPQTPQI